MWWICTVILVEVSESIVCVVWRKVIHHGISFLCGSWGILTLTQTSHIYLQLCTFPSSSLCVCMHHGCVLISQVEANGPWWSLAFRNGTEALLVLSTNDFTFLYCIVEPQQQLFQLIFDNIKGGSRISQRRVTN